MIARSKALASFESRLPDFFSLRLSLRLSQRRCSLCSLSSATSSNRARHSAAVLRCNCATSPAFAALGTSGSGELNLSADLHPSQVHHRHGPQTQMSSPSSTFFLQTSQVPRSPPGPKYAIDTTSPCPRPQRHPVTTMSFRSLAPEAWVPPNSGPRLHVVAGSFPPGEFRRAPCLRGVRSSSRAGRCHRSRPDLSARDQN